MIDDAAYELHKTRFLTLFAEWRSRLRLDGWTINFEWSRGPYEIDGRLQSEAMASVKVRWEYCRATITVDLSEVAEADDAYLEQCVVHEMCHIAVAEMREWQDASNALMHEERTVTQLAWAFLDLAGKPY